MERKSDGPIRVAMRGRRGAFGAQGGVETHVRALVTFLAAMPDEPCSIEIIERSRFASERGSDLVPPRVRLTPLWSPRQATAEAIVHTALGVMYSAVRRPDILHIHGIGPSLMAPLAKLLGLKVVVTHHGQDYNRAKWSGMGRLALRMGEFCAAYFPDARIVIAPGLDEELKARFRRDFEYIPNPMTVAAPADPVETLKRFGLEKGRYIVNVARVVPEKNQLNLVKAFSAVDTPVRLVLVGGEDHSSDYGRMLRSAVKKDDRIVMTGAVGPDVVSSIVSCSGGFVLPSTHEGLPLSLLEAMWYSKPVVVSSIPTLMRLNLPGYCYTDPENMEDMIDKIGQLVVGCEEDSVRNFDWSEYVEDYAIEAVGVRTLNLYKSIVT